MAQVNTRGGAVVEIDEDVQGRDDGRAGGGPRAGGGAARAALRLILGHPPREPAATANGEPVRLGPGGRFLPEYTPYDGERPVA